MIVSLFLLLVGLCIGSFLGALTYRYPRGASIVSGRSHCDFCRKDIKWFDNIPLLSFLLLGGKCRFCKKKISIRNPIIELISGIGFYLIGMNVLGLLLFSICLAIFVIDFEHQIIPDDFIFFGIFVVFIYIFFVNGHMLLPSFLAGLTASLFLLIIYLATKGRGMGLGDVKFAILGGMIVGPGNLVMWMFLAFLTGAVVGIILVLNKKAGLKDKIAFGPFLIIAMPMAIVWGGRIMELLYK